VLNVVVPYQSRNVTGSVAWTHELEGEVLSQVGVTRTLIEEHEDDSGYLIADYYDEAPAYAMTGGTRPWDLPFPDEQMKYMEQDVLVLEPVFYSQVEEITRKHLGGTCQLEFDALPAFGEMEHNGIKVNVDGWREFIKDQAVQAEALGNQVIEVLGPLIKAHQIEEYDTKKAVCDQWVYDRDTHLAVLRHTWEGHTAPEAILLKWGAYKTHMMQEWRRSNPNPGSPQQPPALPNINSHDQLLVAFTALGIPAKDTSEETLKELKDEYSIVDLLLKYRKKNKFVEVLWRDSTGKD